MLGVKELRILPARSEEKAPGVTDPAALVKALSAAKAREVALRCRAEDVVIGADTVVWLDDRVFGKPKTPDEAAEMLRTLSGRTHEVYTGVTILAGGMEYSEAERSAVRFRALSEREIAAYVASGEPMDKAGAYGAQDKAALFVEGIDGDFFNVMGLPLCRLGQMLHKLGVELL